jgi:hypothetical protein
LAGHRVTDWVAKLLFEYVKGGFETVGSTFRYVTMEVLRAFRDRVMRLAQKLKTADYSLKYPMKPERYRKSIPDGNLKIVKV